MDYVKNIVGGGIITLVIGGAAFNFTQEDVVNNMADDTGLTQQQAEQYINAIPADELVSFTEVGSGYVAESIMTFQLADQIDCVDYEYEWETISLTCATGKKQLQQVGAAERSLGQAYIALGADAASESDIRTVIRYLDQLNQTYELPMSRVVLDTETIKELQLTNSYNKSVLRAALGSS